MTSLGHSNRAVCDVELGNKEQPANESQDNNKMFIMKRSANFCGSGTPLALTCLT
jgi:hypothetical protein